MQIARKTYEHRYTLQFVKLKNERWGDFHCSKNLSNSVAMLLKLISSNIIKKKRTTILECLSPAQFSWISRPNIASLESTERSLSKKKTRRPICIVSLRPLERFCVRPWWLYREPKAESIVNVHVTKQTPPTDYDSPSSSSLFGSSKRGEKRGRRDA